MRRGVLHVVVAVICPASYAEICVPLGAPAIPAPTTKCTVGADLHASQVRPGPSSSESGGGTQSSAIVSTVGAGMGGIIAAVAVAAAAAAAAGVYWTRRRSRRRRTHLLQGHLSEPVVSTVSLSESSEVVW